MSIRILMQTLGVVATNAYLIGDTTTGEAVLIDPVDDAPLLERWAHNEGFTIKLILATHAHFDHVLASGALKASTGAPFYIHEDSRMWLETLPQQGQRFGLGLFPAAATPDRWLTDAPETLRVGNIALETLPTHGHSPGHLAYYLRSENAVFSGDSLFAGSIGRTDLPGSDYATLMRHIFRHLLTLGDTCQVYAGHGDPTTIGRERRSNPYILNWDEGEA